MFIWIGSIKFFPSKEILFFLFLMFAHKFITVLDVYFWKKIYAYLNFLSCLRLSIDFHILFL